MIYESRWERCDFTNCNDFAVYYVIIYIFYLYVLFYYIALRPF